MRFVHTNIKTGESFVILIDKEDLPILRAHKWFCRRRGKNVYLESRTPKGNISFHREVMGLTFGDGKMVDHINMNGLDNRRINLRLTNRTENARNRGIPANNTSGYKGVSLIKSINRYQVTVCVDGKNYNLGRYETAEEAAKMYKDVVTEIDPEHWRVE